MSVLDSLTVTRAAAFRQPAWMGLGNVFQEPVTDYAEMLRLSSLDQTVISEEELQVSGGEARFIVPSKALVHTDYSTGERKVLGLVGSERTLIQPGEAFSFLESLSDGAHWEIAGELKDSRVVFGALRLDRETDPILGNQGIQNFLTVAVGYDGTMPLTWFVGPTRPECWNTLTAGMAGASQTGRVRQTKNARDRMEVQRNMFREANGYLDLWEKVMREMAGTEFSDKKFENVIGTLYKRPENEAQNALTRWEDKRDAHFAMWNAEHNSAIRNTAFGAWNVLTEVQQWGRGKRESEKGSESFYLAGAGFDTGTEKFRTESLNLVRQRAGLALV